MKEKPLIVDDFPIYLQKKLEEEHGTYRARDFLTYELLEENFLRKTAYQVCNPLIYLVNEEWVMEDCCVLNDDDLLWYYRLIKDEYPHLFHSFIFPYLDYIYEMMNYDEEERLDHVERVLMSIKENRKELNNYDLYTADQQDKFWAVIGNHFSYDDYLENSSSLERDFENNPTDRFIRFIDYLTYFGDVLDKKIAFLSGYRVNEKIGFSSVSNLPDMHTHIPNDIPMNPTILGLELMTKYRCGNYFPILPERLRYLRLRLYFDYDHMQECEKHKVITFEYIPDTVQVLDLYFGYVFSEEILNKLPIDFSTVPDSVEYLVLEFGDIQEFEFDLAVLKQVKILHIDYDFIEISNLPPNIELLYISHPNSIIEIHHPFPESLKLINTYYYYESKREEFPQQFQHTDEEIVNKYHEIRERRHDWEFRKQIYEKYDHLLHY